MTWCGRLLRRKHLEQELEKELRFHFDQHVNDLIAQGGSQEEARRQASLALGGVEQTKEHSRDARGTRWLEDLLAEACHAIRTLRKSPGFTIVCLLTLALGIGTTPAIFTVVNGVLLKPLSYAHPEQLVNLREKTTWSTAWRNVRAPSCRQLGRAELIQSKHSVKTS